MMARLNIITESIEDFIHSVNDVNKMAGGAVGYIITNLEKDITDVSVNCITDQAFFALGMAFGLRIERKKNEEEKAKQPEQPANGKIIALH